MVGAYILAGEIGRHCGRGDDKHTTPTKTKDLVMALKEYERNMRPLSDYFQEEILKDGPPKFPETQIGLTIVFWVLALANFFGIDVFGRMTIRQPLKGWEVPVYEGMPDYTEKGKEEVKAV